MSKREIADMVTTVKGIPCGVVIESYSPGRPWRQYVFPGAGPGDCSIPEPMELEFYLLDRKGYRADWLQDRMTGDDVMQLADQIEEQRREDHALQGV